jgi:hypothetical protein
MPVTGNVFIDHTLTVYGVGDFGSAPWWATPRGGDSGQEWWHHPWSGIISRMIETSLSPTIAATVLHRVTGTIDQQQAGQGAAEALRFVQRLSNAHKLINLVLDLRGRHFLDLQAHKAWSQGFARNPALQRYVQFVAIIGDDIPAFRAEQELMETARVRFFVDSMQAHEWLAQATPS